jgi:hypothetical protein
MKKILVIIAVVASFTANAQSDKYVAGMTKFLTQLDSAKTGDDYSAAANNFERIANAEKTQWLPFYYAAHALVIKAYQEKDVKNIDPLADRADAFLASAEALSPNNSEITTLKAMATQVRMNVDWSRGMTLGPKCTQMIMQALAQAPKDNPRAVMFQANMLYGTPEPFGGSKAKGIELMKKAVALFASFVQENKMMPNWGLENAKENLASWTK